MNYRTVLDMDLTEITVYGQQEQSAYNGYFESACFHPLLLFNREGDCLAAKLRPGDVHGAESWEEPLCCWRLSGQGMGKEVAFRGDGLYPSRRSTKRCAGLKLHHLHPGRRRIGPDIAELLPHPAGRPSQKRLVEYKGFLYLPDALRA